MNVRAPMTEEICLTSILARQREAFLRHLRRWMRPRRRHVAMHLRPAGAKLLGRVP